MPPLAWLLSPNRASFSHEQLSAACTLPQLERGINGWMIRGQSIDATLLGPQLPAPPRDDQAHDDIYSRESDLVVTRPAHATYPFRTQIYWRLASQPWWVQQRQALGTLELVISQQTDLLDSRPRLVVRSSLPFAEAFCLVRDFGTPWDSVTSVVGGILVRLPECELSYAEMVFPQDFIRMGTKVENGRITLEHELLTDRLEKGVILRARVLGIWLNREDDLATARAHYDYFAASDPPLTT